MDVLKLSDGSVEIVGNTRDFSELLDRKLGMDVSMWFNSFVEEHEALKEEFAALEEEE
jgi:hypothetical protein